jgi:hypothetical protein
MKSLQILQNKSAKIILDRPLHSSATDALNALGWVRLEERRRLHRCLYIYKCINNLASHSFTFTKKADIYDYNIRSKDNLRLPKVKRNWGKQRTVYQAVKEWNDLSQELRNSSSVPVFKRNFLS